MYIQFVNNYSAWIFHRSNCKAFQVWSRIHKLRVWAEFAIFLKHTSSLSVFAQAVNEILVAIVRLTSFWFISLLVNLHFAFFFFLHLSNCRIFGIYYTTFIEATIRISSTCFLLEDIKFNFEVLRTYRH